MLMWQEAVLVKVLLCVNQSGKDYDLRVQWDPVLLLTEMC
jgi:hypothetical protein